MRWQWSPAQRSLAKAQQGAPYYMRAPLTLARRDSRPLLDRRCTRWSGHQHIPALASRAFGLGRSADATPVGSHVLDLDPSQRRGRGEARVRGRERGVRGARARRPGVRRGGVLHLHSLHLAARHVARPRENPHGVGPHGHPGGPRTGALTGPFSGTSSPGPGATAPARTFLVTYRAWDAGVYQAVVANPCFTLVLPRVRPTTYHNNSCIAQVATWALRVQARQQDEERGGGGGRTSSLLDGLLGRGVAETKAAPAFEPSPCSETLQGRWKAVEDSSISSNRQGSKVSGTGSVSSSTSSTSNTNRSQGEAVEYSWEPYECAKWVPQTEVLASLAAKGVKEVAFIGDSHLRFLLLHSYLLTEGKVYPELLKAHANFTVSVPIPPAPNANSSPAPAAAGGRTAAGKAAGAQAAPRQKAELFSFYWVDGVFKNGEFGCGTRGTFSH